MITSRNQLIQYALRALGSPVIQVNVSTEQLEDRVDEAIAYYNNYHYDGVERIYLKHQITAEDKTNRSIPLPDNIRGISRVLSLNTTTVNSILNYETQFKMSMIANLHNSRIQEYQMTMNYLQMIDTLLSGQPIVRFNHNRAALNIDINWDKMVVGTYIVVDCYASIDPEIDTKMYNDIWLKSYLIALIKRQWGLNMSKYDGLQLPGGVTVNGMDMYNNAVSEIADLEQRLQNEAGVLDIYIG